MNLSQATQLHHQLSEYENLRRAMIEDSYYDNQCARLEVIAEIGDNHKAGIISLPELSINCIRREIERCFNVDLSVANYSYMGRNTVGRSEEEILSMVVTHIDVGEPLFVIV